MPEGGVDVQELEERLSQVVAARDEAAKAAGRKVPLLIKLGSLDALGTVETTVLTLAKLGCEGVVGLNVRQDAFIGLLYGLTPTLCVHRHKKTTTISSTTCQRQM